MPEGRGARYQRNSLDDGRLSESATAVVGVGGHVAELGDAWVSHRQAELAARAARRVPGLAGVGVWAELGELAVLAQLPDDALAAPAVTGPLRALADHDGGARLRETLRCFLDNGGSVPRTAAALHLHPAQPVGAAGTDGFGMGGRLRRAVPRQRLVDLHHRCVAPRPASRRADTLRCLMRQP